MSKVAILTDSNAGITQSQAKEMGIFVIPMPFYIDDQEYFEDINLTQEEFYEKLKGDALIHTSQPSPQYVLDAWDELLKENDQVLYIPMSSSLSSSCATGIMLSEDYEGRVFVVDNQRISITMVHAIKDSIKMAGEGKNAEEIRSYLEDSKSASSIYITLDTLSYLKKGGRITPAAAMLGSLLKIKPVLQIQGGKLDEFAKSRTLSAAKSLMLSAIKEDIDGRITENHKYKYEISITHTENYEAAEQFKKEVQELFPDAENIIIAPLSLSVSCHIGPGALAVGASRVL